MLIETDTKRYPLYIGQAIRHDLATLINDGKKRYSSFLIISDETVAPLYLDDVRRALPAKVYTHLVPSGEQAKSIEQFYHCHTTALEKGLDRNACIIALGGGVVGDLAGFVAATYLRGISFIQMPTTLLAHDSSVGGKVAINHRLGKNMIGAFYQPDAVVYDVDTLQSLSDREWRSGFAEVIKHGLIWDKALYEQLLTSIHSLDDLKRADLPNMLRRAIAVKADIVSQDEKEQNIRSFLNFGHTLGHAIEAVLGYGQMSHGEAISVGMLFAMRMSSDYYQKALPVEPLRKWLKSLGYKTEIPHELNADDLHNAMKKDKKVRNGTIHMVLLKEVGQVENVAIDDKMMRSHLTKELGM